jgi:hypothetical protein
MLMAIKGNILGETLHDCMARGGWGWRIEDGGLRMEDRGQSIEDRGSSFRK